MSLVGCASVSPITSKKEFNGIAAGDLFYAGSSESTNYFVGVDHRLRLTRYSCSQDVYPIHNRFPKTEDRTKWKVFIREFANKKGGFKGEEMQYWYPWEQKAESGPRD